MEGVLTIAARKARLARFCMLLSMLISSEEASGTFIDFKELECSFSNCGSRKHFFFNHAIEKQ
jgi:hypothetical protein